MQPTARTLTVSALAKPNRRASVGSANRVPFIRLLGDWLARAGFQPGERVTVQVTANQIIITRQ